MAKYGFPEDGSIFNASIKHTAQLLKHIELDKQDDYMQLSYFGAEASFVPHCYTSMFQIDRHRQKRQTIV